MQLALRVVELYGLLDLSLVKEPEFGEHDDGDSGDGCPRIQLKQPPNVRNAPKSAQRRQYGCGPRKAVLFAFCDDPNRTLKNRIIFTNEEARRRLDD